MSTLQGRINTAGDACLTIDQRNLGTILQPDDEAEVASILSEASARGQSVIPVGGATHLFWGNPPRSADLGLQMNRLDRILAYHPEDMLVTVQAGCPFSRIQEQLADKSQFLPIDPFHLSQSSIGGLAALNAYGPIRLQHGRLRDHILGMRVVTAEGSRTKCGGQVVKNVSGYDLSKFYAGSLGWLGVFTEFHLKTSPLPECTRSGGIIHKDFQALQNLGQAVLDKGLLPRAQVLTSAGWVAPYLESQSAPDDSILWIQFAGHPQTVSWQWDQVAALAPSFTTTDWIWPDESEMTKVWRGISNFGFEDAWSEGVLLKIIAPYSMMGKLVEQGHDFSQRFQCPVSWLGYAGSNLVWLHFPIHRQAQPPWDKMAYWLEELRLGLRPQRGELILVRGPRPLKDLFEVWGVEGKTLELMLEIKKRLDPKGILNPGRFVGRC